MNHKFPTPDGQTATRCVRCGINIFSPASTDPCLGKPDKNDLVSGLATEKPKRVGPAGLIKGGYDVRRLSYPTIADALRQIADDIDAGQLEVCGSPVVVVLR